MSENNTMTTEEKTSKEEISKKTDNRHEISWGYLPFLNPNTKKLQSISFANVNPK